MERRHEIDRSFRFTWDFCLVWLVFFIVTLYTFPTSKGAHSYEHPLASLLVSLFATFLIYGPVLLVRQVVRSGSRGWFVARVFLSLLLLLFVATGIFYFTGYTPERGHVFGAIAGFSSIAFLHWRLERRDD
jgi:hypothetical protein